MGMESGVADAAPGWKRRPVRAAFHRTGKRRVSRLEGSSMKLCMLALCLATAASAQEMKAAVVEGAVSLASGAAVQPGDALHAGDTVQTGAESRLEIALPAGSVLRLGENSRLFLRESEPEKAFSARLLLGDVWARVHKLIGGETFHIETENAVAGVRGTEFRVEVAPQHEDLIRVYEGTVQVDGDQWSQRVEAAHELRFHKDRDPGAAGGFDPSSEKGHKFMDWVRSRRDPADRNPEREQRRRDRRERRKER
jgi:hypothetical protein